LKVKKYKKCSIGILLFNEEASGNCCQNWPKFLPKLASPADPASKNGGKILTQMKK